MLCLLVIAGCDTGGEDDPVQQFPAVNVGDAWVMTRTQVLGLDRPEFEPNISVKQDTIRVLEQVSIHGETWFRIGNRERVGFIISVFDMLDLYAFREEGIFQLTRDSLVVPLLLYDRDSETEYAVRDGIRGRFVRSDSLIQTSALGDVTGTLYTFRLGTDYQPLEGQTGGSGMIDQLFLEKAFFLESLWSPELGLLKTQSMYITMSRSGEALIVAGTDTWEIEQFLPALDNNESVVPSSAAKEGAVPRHSFSLPASPGQLR